MVRSADERLAVSTPTPERRAEGAARCRYQKGQHVICASPTLVERHLKAAGSAGLVIDPQKIVWVPYIPDREYDK